VFATSTALVLLGVVAGGEYVPPGRDNLGVGGPLINGFVRWDGHYYRAIAEDGYSYWVGKASTIHFMPLYPVLSRGVRRLTGLPTKYALVLTTHLCFLGALALLSRYTERRYGAEVPTAGKFAVLALGFLPTSVFFHVAYTESLFVLLCLCQLLLIQRGAHPLLVALVVCLGVVARPVGVAMVPPLILYAWRSGGRGVRALGLLFLCLAIAFAGLGLFMGYCSSAFGDALAFMRDREDLWRLRPRLPLLAKLRLLLLLEPLWALFVPGSRSYWGRFLTPGQVCFNTYPLGPLYFVGGVLLVTMGGWRGRLNRYEVTLALGLLLVPYWLTGYHSALVSMARYVSVIPPLYSFGGLLLSRIPAAVVGFLAVLGGLMMAIYAAQFAQGQWVI
jgi:hypothetical protein